MRTADRSTRASTTAGRVEPPDRTRWRVAVRLEVRPAVRLAAWLAVRPAVWLAVRLAQVVARPAQVAGLVARCLLPGRRASPAGFRGLEPRAGRRFARALVSLFCAVAALTAVPPAAEARPGRYGWPLAPPHPVLRPFTAPTTTYGPGHRGVDLGGSVDEPVFAARDGTVLFAGEVGGRPLVSVAHDDGLRTTYEPVAPTVREGEPINRGDRIGTLLAGHEGCSTAACLHWGARRGLEYVNPIRLVSPGRVRLLPVPPAAMPTRGPPR